MPTNDPGPDKATGSRPTNRIENAADQYRKGRLEAEHPRDEVLLKELERHAYEALTGGFRRASELPETTRQTPYTDGAGDQA